MQPFAGVAAVALRAVAAASVARGPMAARCVSSCSAVAAAAAKTAAAASAAPAAAAAAAAAAAPAAAGKAAVDKKAAGGKAAVDKKAAAGETKVWKPAPGGDGAMLTERNIHEQFRNLLTLAAHHMPPRPEALHRVLASVRSKADLAVATKALHVAQDNRMLLTAQTTGLWVGACIAGGDPARAVATLRDAPTTRLFPTKAAVTALLGVAGAKKDAALVAATTALLTHPGTGKGPLVLNAVGLARQVRSHAAVGDFHTALRVYGALTGAAAASKAAGAHAKFATVGLLLGATRAATGPTPDQVAALYATAVPLARTLPAAAPLVAEFEAKFPAPAAAPAAAAAAAPAAAAAAAPAAPAAAAAAPASA